MAPDPLKTELLNALGEDFVQRLRRGEHPSISRYVRDYAPEQASEITEFLESIAMLEDLKQANGASADACLTESMPKEFGRYHIERTLGEGGMGAVYLAHDSQLNRKVALKTPKFAQHSDPLLIDRFYREARSAATLHHPNICPVYDVGELDGIHYISMAYIAGHPLSDYTRAKKLPPIGAAVRVVRKVALALHEAHRRGVVHRDLKPANIVIDRHKEPIVMDFGLARQFGPDDSAETPLLSNADPSSTHAANVEARLTRDGTLLGSPGYMAPEQIRGRYRGIGPASDVYALGVLLFELLTGELPFPGDGSLNSIVAAVLSSDPPDASVIRADIDPQLAAICCEAMAKNPGDRFESMQAFASALAGFLRSENDAAPSHAIPDVGAYKSEALVRAKEQCELVRALYHEGQYTAATSILEKMASNTDAPIKKYIEWAQNELPRVRAKAQRQASGALATPPAVEDSFWDQGVAVSSGPAVQAATSVTGSPSVEVSTNTSKSAPRRSTRSGAAMSRWRYAVVAVPVALVGLLFAVMLTKPFWASVPADTVQVEVAQDDSAGSSVGKKVVVAAANSEATDQTAKQPGLVQQPQIGETEADRGGGDSAESTVADDESDRSDDVAMPGRRRRSGRYGAGARPNADRMLQQFDSNHDGKLSKAELGSVQRMPRKSPARRALDKFDEFDQSPADGLLDAAEIRRAIIGSGTPFDSRAPGAGRPADR